MSDCPNCGVEMEFVPFDDEYFCYECEQFYPKGVSGRRSVARSPRSNMKSIVGAAVIIMIIIGALVLSLYLARQVEYASSSDFGDLNGGGNGGNGGGVVEIIGLDFSPDEPIPDEEITVTVYTKNCNGCKLDYYSFFSSGGSGVKPLTKVEDGIYEADFGPFGDGTEVWVIIIADGSYDSFDVSEDNFIMVGDVERSDISGLRLYSIKNNPENPTTDDQDIIISAGVVSDYTIEQVELQLVIIRSSGTVSRGGTMTEESLNTYEKTMDLTSSIFDTTESGMMYYVIAAYDETGNTARSDVVKLPLI